MVAILSFLMPSYRLGPQTTHVFCSTKKLGVCIFLDWVLNLSK